MESGRILATNGYIHQSLSSELGKAHDVWKVEKKG